MYSTVTFAVHASRVTAAPAGPVTSRIDVREGTAFGRICVWPPGDVG